MVQRIPEPSDLEPIERASKDELQALQLQRMQWSLRHAYDNVAHYRAAFDAAGVHPDDLRTLADLAKFPFTGKKDPARQLPVRHVRSAAGPGGAGARVQRHHRQADRGRLHAERHRHLGQRGGALDPRGRRPPGDMVHISYGYGLFTGGLGAHYGAERLGCTVIPMSGGQTEKQVQLIQDFKPSIIMVTPSYMLNIIEEFQRQGIDPATPARSRSASSAPSRGPTPCGARSSGAPASTRSTSTACRK
jgi:phenylacetate-CoA ligase